MTSTQIPARGDKVTGTYFGVPFTGTVYQARWHTLNDSRITHVNLDAPITVYGRERASTRRARYNERTPRCVNTRGP